MTTDKLNNWDTITASNTARVAERLGEIGICDKRTLPSLEDRIAVVQMMTTKIEWRGASRWESSGTDLAPWHIVQCATRGWSDFDNLLTGDAFLGCLARALDFGGSGVWSGVARSPQWDASAAEIIEHTRAHYIESHEDAIIDPDDEAILALPPALIVGVHLRMESYFMDCIRDEADLIVDGSIESIQRDIQKRWCKVIDAIIESRKDSIESRKDSEEAANA